MLTTPSTSKSPTRTAQILLLLKSLSTWLLNETRNTLVACGRQTARMVNYCRCLLRRRFSSKEVEAARFSFGQKAFAAGLGNPQIRARILAIDEQINNIRAQKRSSRALDTEHRKLVLQLADTSTESETQPNHEPTQLQKSQLLHREHQEATRVARLELLPQQSSEWMRVVLGYSCACCLILMALILITRESSSPSRRSLVTGDDQSDTAKIQMQTVGAAEATKTALPVSGSTSFTVPLKESERVTFAKKLGKDVIAEMPLRQFLKEHPAAKKNLRESDGRQKRVAYDTLLFTYVFRDDKLFFKSFTIPRYEDYFKKDHQKTMECLGDPDRDLLTDDERRDGVLHHYAWWVTECDLLIRYVVQKKGREYHQIYSIGRISVLDEGAE